MPLRLKRYPKRGPYWYIRGTVQGVRVFESTGQSQRREAAKVLEARQKEIFERRVYGVDRTLTFAEAALAYMNRGGESRFLDRIIERIGLTPVADIDQDLIDDTAAALYPGAAPDTRRRQVYTPIRSVLNDVARARRLAVPTFENPKTERKYPEPAGDAHIRALLPHCGPRLKAMVLLLTYTGIRVSEACRLEDKDFNLQEGWAVCGRTKNGEPRLLPLPPVVVAAVANVISPEGPALGFASRDAVNKALQRAAKRAGIQHKSSHKIGRHTFAARILAAGHDIKTLKEAGGWKSIRIVDETYGHLSRDRVHKVMIDVANASGTDCTDSAHLEVCSSRDVPQEVAKSGKKRKA